MPIYSRSRSGKGCPEAASEKQVRLPGPHRLTMGRHWLLVCAVALAADVAQEYIELARRRLALAGPAEGADARSRYKSHLEAGRQPTRGVPKGQRLKGR